MYFLLNFQRNITKLDYHSADTLLTTAPGSPLRPSGPCFPAVPCGPTAPVLPGGPKAPDSP